MKIPNSYKIFFYPFIIDEIFRAGYDITISDKGEMIRNVF